MTRFFPRRRIRKEKLLIRGQGEEEADETPEQAAAAVAAQPIVAHWSRNLTLTIVQQSGAVNFAGLQPLVQPYFRMVPSAEDQPKLYYPPMFPNDFWLLRENLHPINETTPTLSLRVDYHTLSPFKFQMFSAMTQSFEQAAQQPGGSGAEMDEVKRMLTETSPWLLGTTAIVTILHMVFEFLAFSSGRQPLAKEGQRPCRRFAEDDLDELLCAIGYPALPP